MTQMSPAMDAALAGAVVTIFGAIEIVLPSYTIRLLDTGGVVIWPQADGSQKIFTGGDAKFGSIYKVESLTDGVGDEAPAWKITFTPASDAAAVDLSSPDMQGSTVTLWLGVVDPATGKVVGDPDPVFYGVLDTTTLNSGLNSRSLDMVISSAFEDFFLNDDGARLSDTFHQYVWPGEKGMSFVTYITHQIYWGSDAPNGVTT